MKFAAVVFRNITASADSVKFKEVSDALLTGGIALEEISLVPYDDPGVIMGTLERLRRAYSCVFVICDRVLVSVAREAVSAVTGKSFEEEVLFDGGDCLFAVLPDGTRGRDLVFSKVIPTVDQKRGNSYHSVVIGTVYAPPSKVMAAVARAQDEAGDKLSIHTSEQYGVGRIEVIYDRLTPKVSADEAVRIIASELKDYVYAMEDVGIAQRLFEALTLHRLKLSTAESFTGGGVGQAIVSIPGASRVFYEGICAYDSDAKKNRLKVAEYTLKNKGAVSSETAYEMAASLLKEGHCDVAIATTGIAGPGSDGSGAPAGLCYIAVGMKQAVRVYEYRLCGDRESVTKQAINLALFSAYKEIH